MENKRKKLLPIGLVLILAVAVIYSVVITKERDALNKELKTVQSVLVLTQSELGDTKQSLTSTKTELGDTKQSLASTQAELSSTTQKLSSAQQYTANLQYTLSMTEKRLAVAQETLGGLGITLSLSKECSDVSLIDNPEATNPTWSQLMTFLSQDQTEKHIYIKDKYDCSQFSRDVHNNAEAAGIRAAEVQIEFRGEFAGHALNAFLTTDRGLAYVDCTGRGFHILKVGLQLSEQASLDKIAYVARGKEYGSVSLGTNTLLDYASYEKIKGDWLSYDQKLEAYNRDVQAFNREIFGKVYYIGTTEWSRIKAWESSLKLQEMLIDSLRAQLEPIWEPLGITESIKIFW